MKNFLLIGALTFLSSASFSKEVDLSPGSSLIVDREPVTVTCAYNGQVTHYCEGSPTKALLYKNEPADADSSETIRVVDQFNSITACLAAINGSNPSSLEIPLTPGSSANLNGELITVSCADDNRARFSCKGKFSRFYVYENTTNTSGEKTSRIVKNVESMEDCLAFIKRGGEQQASFNLSK